MEEKEYKRIPVFPSTKKRLAVAKEKSDFRTYDEYINYLLDKEEQTEE